MARARPRLAVRLSDDHRRHLEFGFPDAIQQRCATFLDELAHGPKMHGSFRCVTPEEAADTHRIVTAAPESDRAGSVVRP